jgi:hypothetical protein
MQFNISASPIKYQEETLSKRYKDTNRANQMNPNNDAYWQARGWKSRPGDWKERLSTGIVLAENSQGSSSSRPK